MGIRDLDRGPSLAAQGDLCILSAETVVQTCSFISKSRYRRQQKFPEDSRSPPREQVLGLWVIFSGPLQAHTLEFLCLAYSLTPVSPHLGLSSSLHPARIS